MLLSEAFQQDRARQYVGGCLECEARMLNINYGHNRELMKKCKRLEECIREGILRDILISQKAEVLELVLTTFNKELYEEGLREDAVREGLEEGRKEGRKEQLIMQVQKKLNKNKTVDEIADELEEDIVVVQSIIEEMKRR